ncbi:hypothetical protein NESM_000797900 [Novymonas esmeraldas]|uniref:Uncharacterized protein n=1 Tax=Novymonas esmeraldas TaxID=1808958 RepID=A0AAW0EVS2_9TRYP
MGKAAPRSRHGKTSNKKREQHRGADAEESDVVVHSTGLVTAALPPTSLAPCVRQLRESTDYSALEEACGDVAHFGLQSRHHSAFVAAAVPQRLAQLLLATSPYDTTTAARSDAATAAGTVPEPHRGVLYMQVAAAEALRSLITNSEQDLVVDLLTSADVEAVCGGSFTDGLVRLLHADWNHILVARRSTTPEDWMQVYTGDDDDAAAVAATADVEATPAEATTAHRRRGNSCNVYFTLLRHLEEVLVLTASCVEASEACAEAVSQPAALLLLLDVLRSATTTTWETLLHPSANYYLAESTSTAAVTSETVLAMRAYKRREADLLASLAVSVGDVLLLLSPENPMLAHVFTGAGAGGGGGGASASMVASAEQRAFLNTAVDAVDLRAWLAGKPTIEAQLQERLSDGAALPSFLGPQHSAMALERERVLHDLLRATLHLHGMLLHIAPVADNIQRVLPLLSDALHKVSLPMRVWCGVLPLLMGTAECADDEVRVAATRLATHRLRSTQSAVRLLCVVVNAIGEKNNSELHGDDEAAFAANPLAALLQSGSLLYAVGLLLKDVLWMSPYIDADVEGGVSSPSDVMARQQRALRAEASTNAAAAEVQMVLLSTEVNVWEVASTLLLMLPVESLGEPALTWRAIQHAVRSRYGLHLDAVAAEAADEGGEVRASSIIQCSPSTHRLLWMQLEALGQMLWTLQRKQAKAHANAAGGAAVPFNHVQATAADVDLLVRLSWETPASALLKQSCVGAVGLLCASMQDADAVATATRFALAVALNGGSATAAVVTGRTLLDIYAQLVPAATPTLAAEQRGWLQQLAVVDSVATVRCEAANTLVDLFLDERYDTSVYWPLGVQDVLRGFAAQLTAYVKRRQQLNKETRRRGLVSTETPDAEQWAELLDNLGGFLAYKAQHK